MSESENNKENADVKEENGNNDNSTEVAAVTAASPIPDADAGAIANLSDRSSIDKITKGNFTLLTLFY